MEILKRKYRFLVRQTHGLSSWMADEADDVKSVHQIQLTALSLLQELEENVNLQLEACTDDEVDAIIEDFMKHTTILSKLKRKVVSSATPPSSPSPSSIPRQEFHLPTISLPTFEGSITEWPSFSAQFTDRLSHFPSLTGAQKFHYLQSSLKGSARTVIRAMPTPEKSFKVAWELLQDRYDNKRVFELEKAPFRKISSLEEQQVKENYKNTTNILPNGRFEVCLSLKQDHERLSTNKQIALSRLKSMERRMSYDPTFSQLYHEKMSDAIKEGLMALIKTTNKGTGPIAPLPDHGVLYESYTTILRVVFDGLANPSKPVQHYRLSIEVWGTKCATYLPTHTLNEISNMFKDHFPIVCEKLRKYFYIGDALTGPDSICSAKYALQILKQFLHKHGFTLHKWASNEPTVLEDVNGDDKNAVGTKNILDHSQVNKALGILWNAEEEAFKCIILLPSFQRVRKKAVLTQTGTIFDPLGCLASPTIPPKIFIQQLWSQKPAWDQSLPQTDASMWRNIASDLSRIENIKLPHTIMSDCGSNIQARRLQENSLTEHVHWRFNPPGAPNFWGLWEDGVKSMKYHLHRIVGATPLAYEEMTTVLHRIEACMNSRPLTALSSDPSDYRALTPAHFLIGGDLLSIPEEESNSKVPILKRWEMTQRMAQHFWKRWASEYLTRLQQRPKWATKQENLKIGQLVIIKEDGAKPLEWKLGRITAVFPASDGQVRSATVRTALRSLQRPIVKLCPLPLD